MSGQVFPGVYLGLCSNVNDPEGKNRIKGVIPQVFGDGVTESDWAWPSLVPNLSTVFAALDSLYAAAHLTPPVFSFLPKPGQQVWFAFQSGDPEYPIWLGVN